MTAVAPAATEVHGDGIGRAAREEDLPGIADRSARSSDIGAAVLGRNAALPPRRASGSFDDGVGASFDALAAELRTARRLGDATACRLATARPAIGCQPSDLAVAALIPAGAGARPARLRMTGPAGFGGAGQIRAVTGAQ